MRGFTLIEVVVALALAGVVLLGARAMLESVAASAERVSAASRVADRDANAERLLRALVGRLEVGTKGAGEFAGAERAATFTSWCDVPAGWQERCAVTLAFDSARSGGMALVARTSRAGGVSGADTDETVVLRDDIDDGALRYLSDAGAGGTWFREWGRGVTAPLAIGVILVRAANGESRDSTVPVRADTLILRIGERG